LYGKRLTLVPLTAAHADVLFPFLADTGLWTYTDESAPAGVDALRERYRRLETRRSPDGSQLWLNWALETRDEGFAGLVQATVAVLRDEAAVAYVIARRFWSRGLGTEAVGMLLEFLREQLRVTKAVASVDGRNVPSVRLLRRLGFEGTNDSDLTNLRFELRLTDP
jgi:[ribosomal protein S5]-alanine N-acetyltransferase